MFFVIGNFALHVERKEFGFEQFFDLLVEFAHAQHGAFGKKRSNQFGVRVSHKGHKG